jgi:hypothetical protein
VWGYATNTYINKLQTFQNKFLCTITKLPRAKPSLALLEQTGMPLIRSYTKKLKGRFHANNCQNFGSYLTVNALCKLVTKTKQLRAVICENWKENIKTLFLCVTEDSL